ncbi:hypothetical protein ACWD3I_25815 [Streptomyces sp. NPDC002817]|uniref:hypothetical protein n=1 Tax=Streptomyces sp. NPDC088357 TaxID=3154655 RepID=UPI003447886F
MTETRDPSEHLVVRVLRLQIEEGHLWLDPEALTEDMIIRWFGVSRTAATRVLHTLSRQHPGQNTAFGGAVRTPPAEPFAGDTRPRPTASTVTDADLDQLHAELAQLRLQLSEQRAAG